MPSASSTPVTTYTLRYQVQGQASFVQAALATQRAQDAMARSTRDLNTQQERLTARLQAAQNAITGLSRRENELTRSVNDHAAALGKLMPEYTRRYNQLGNLYQRLATATATGNANQVRLIQGQINKLVSTYGPLFLEVENFNKVLDKEREKLSKVSHELNVKRTMVEKLNNEIDDLPDKLNEAADAATNLDSALQNQGIVTDAVQESQTGLNNAFARGIVELERFNHTGSRVVRTLEALYRGQTGGSLLGVFGTGGASTATLLKFALIAGGIVAAIAAVGVAVKAVRGGIEFVSNAFRDGLAAASQFAQQGLAAVVNIGGQVATALQGITTEALGVVATYERFVLSSRALLAVSMTQTGQFESVGAAMGEAGKQAGLLLAWMERLGIESPFGIDDVRQVMQFSQAMGFNEGQARRLTTALVDWGSAMGVGGDEMRRVALALGQMSRLGRISSQDVMQLAQVFIDFDGTVARAMGKTPQEIRRMREEGILPVQEALNSLVTQLETDFKGAAKEQARSINGLIESLQDLRNIYLREFFGPIDTTTLKVGGVIGLIQEKMGALVDTLRSPGILNAVRDWGIQLEHFARNAFTWGQNIAISFANGIVAGIAYVVRALSGIGQVITYWLQSHSPPRLLPDIDKWGMSTMLSWLKGFSLANVNVFGEISSTLTSLLQSSVIDPNNKGAKLGIIERIFGTREAIGRVIDEMTRLGKVTSSMVDAVSQATGANTPETRSYVEAMLRLELQNTKVAAAQKRLNDVTKHYQDLLKPIEDQLKRIDDAQADLLGGIRKTHLELILDDPNATAEEKELARLEIAKLGLEQQKRAIEAEAKIEIDAAQAELDAELEKQKLLQEEADLRRKVIEQQIEQNRLLQEYLSVLDSLKEKAKGGGGETALENNPFAFLGFPPLGGKEMPGLGKGGNPFQKFFQPIIDALAEFRAMWDNLWLEIQKRLEPVWFVANRLRTEIEGFFEDIEADMPMIQQVFGETIAATLADVLHWTKISIILMTITVKKLREIWDEHGEDITKFVAFMLRTFVSFVAAIIVLTIIFVTTVTLWVGIMLDTISSDWFKVMWNLPAVMGGAIAAIIIALPGWIQTIINIAGAKFTELKTKVTEKMDEIKTWFKTQDWAALGRNFVQGIIDGAGALAGKLFAKVREIVGGMFSAAFGAGDYGSPSKKAIRELGIPFAEGMAIGILKGTPLVRQATAAMVTPPASARQMYSSSISTTDARQFNLNVNSNRQSDSIIHDFAIMQAMAGA